MSDQTGTILMCSNSLALCMINNVEVNDCFYNKYCVSMHFFRILGPVSNQTWPWVCWIKQFKRSFISHQLPLILYYYSSKCLLIFFFHFTNPPSDIGLFALSSSITWSEFLQRWELCGWGERGHQTASWQDNRPYDGVWEPCCSLALRHSSSFTFSNSSSPDVMACTVFLLKRFCGTAGLMDHGGLWQLGMQNLQHSVSTVGLWMFYKQHLCQSTAYVLDLCTTQYTVFHVCNIVCVLLLEIISPAWSNGNLM